MLKIINDLKPFFEDCYVRINVRQYARLMKITPPTASALLKYYVKEGLLLKEIDRNYIMFHANRENAIFIDLSRIYWRNLLGKLLDFLENKLTDPTIVLFGSLSKAEAKQDSDVDLAVFSTKKEIDLKEFETKVKRKIQLFWFDSIDSVKSKELRNNILNGYILRGRVI